MNLIYEDWKNLLNRFVQKYTGVLAFLLESGLAHYCKLRFRSCTIFGAITKSQVIYLLNFCRHYRLSPELLMLSLFAPHLPTNTMKRQYTIEILERGFPPFF